MLIEESARTAALGGVNRIVIKTPCEALRIPGAADNARGMSLSAKGISAAAHTQLDWAAVETEECRIETSVRQLLARILDLRPGDLAACVVAAFSRGYLDVPFSPSSQNAGRVLTARDETGAVRFLDTGAMPLPDAVMSFDKEVMDERLGRLGIPRDEAWRLVVSDVLRTTREGVRWPLDRGIGRRISGLSRPEADHGQPHCRSTSESPSSNAAAPRASLTFAPVKYGKG